MRTFALRGIGRLAVCITLGSLAAVAASGATSNPSKRVELCEQFKRNLEDSCAALEALDCTEPDASDWYDCTFGFHRILDDISYYELRCGEYTGPWDYPEDCDPRTYPAPDPREAVSTDLPTTGELAPSASLGGARFTSATPFAMAFGMYSAGMDDADYITDVPFTDFELAPETDPVSEFDLVPTGNVSFGGTSDLKTLIVHVRNIGDGIGRGGRGIAALNVDGNVYTGSLFRNMPDGSISTGDFPPGAFGIIQVWHATDFGNLSHCDRVDVEIDAEREVQSGTQDVFDNDRDVLGVREMGNATECASDEEPQEGGGMRYFPTVLNEPMAELQMR